MYLVVLSSWCQSPCHVMYKLRHLKTSFWKLKLKGENELTPGFESIVGCNMGVVGTLSAALA